MAEAVVAEWRCIKSMGNSDFRGLLVIKSSHLCNHWGYRHGIGFNVQLNNSAIL